ncbi:MAG: RidA family protein [Solirubrobacteraceae bacterium]
MEKRKVNPWTWQDQFGFAQAWRVDGAQSVVFVSGQISISPEGEIVGEGDFEAQVRQCFENLRTVLAQSDAGLEDIVKLTVFLTDISQLPTYRQVKSEFIAGDQPASTALEVRSLAIAALMIELEAIAVVA